MYWNLLRLLTLLFSFLGLLNESWYKKINCLFNNKSCIFNIVYNKIGKLYKIAYFHLNIHAIFKSLIFICFGFVILSSYHSQDKRLVSVLYLNPLIKIIYYFSCLCLAGLPFLRAFFSKDFDNWKNNRSVGVKWVYVFLLIFFLGVRIYYSLKLLQLGQVNFSHLLFEKRWFRFI